MKAIRERSDETRREASQEQVVAALRSSLKEVERPRRENAEPAATVKEPVAAKDVFP
ncbi:polyketide synthase docking domain-containing protein [Amycolatopsis sp. WAC 04197]|uniref:polyketide synthase docking domain-containing protein n=1 Tax=Amycolatopsis sp. WAC 04197 TaxID=2203199 RepID=UPI0021034BB8|nr:polyketide synthase docking domain-containing protein [Amycolatopsis sp. WAC 04197]